MPGFGVTAFGKPNMLNAILLVPLQTYGISMKTVDNAIK